MWNVAGVGGYAYMGTGDAEKNSGLSTSFCCKPKIALKKREREGAGHGGVHL